MKGAITHVRIIIKKKYFAFACQNKVISCASLNKNEPCNKWAVTQIYVHDYFCYLKSRGQVTLPRISSHKISELFAILVRACNSRRNSHLSPPTSIFKIPSHLSTWGLIKCRSFNYFQLTVNAELYPQDLNVHICMSETVCPQTFTCWEGAIKPHTYLFGVSQLKKCHANRTRQPLVEFFFKVHNLTI